MKTWRAERNLAHGKGEWADLKNVDENLEMLERFCSDENFGKE